LVSISPFWGTFRNLCNPRRRPVEELILLLCAVAALGVVAVASAATGRKAATPLPVIGISEVNKTLTVTGTPQSGATELDFTTDLKAKGLESGTTIGLIHLNPGVTPEQFAAGIKPDGSNIDQFGSLDTTEDLSKGQTVKIQTVLKTGQYVVADLNSSPKSNLHTVIDVAQSPAPAALPAADATIRMKDYRFTGPRVLKRGELVRIENTGKEQHMAIAIKVKNSKAAKQIEALLRKGKDRQVEKGLKVVGELQDDVSPGAVNQGVLTLPRGTWVLACFMTTAKGVEHTRLGMERTLVVK
jgi:hypothetical protein